MTTTTRAAQIIAAMARTLSQGAPDELESAIDAAAVAMVTADMTARLQYKRSQGKRGWWNPHTCSTHTLARLLRQFIAQGEILDAINIATFLYCREGGAEAVQRVMAYVHN